MSSWKGKKKGIEDTNDEFGRIWRQSSFSSVERKKEQIRTTLNVFSTVLKF